MMGVGAGPAARGPRKAAARVETRCADLHPSAFERAPPHPAFGHLLPPLARVEKDARLAAMDTTSVA